MMPEALFLCHPVLKLTTEVRELNFGNAMVLSVSVRNRMYLPVKTKYKYLPYLLVVFT